MNQVNASNKYPGSALEEVDAHWWIDEHEVEVASTRFKHEHESEVASTKYGARFWARLQILIL